MNLTGEQRVRFLLAAVPYYRERQFSGNYADNDDINDILAAVEDAGLTERQRQIIELVFIEDMTQKDVAKKIGTSQQNISKQEVKAVKKITESYEKGNEEWI